MSEGRHPRDSQTLLRERGVCLGRGKLFPMVTGSQPQGGGVWLWLGELMFYIKEAFPKSPD